MTLQQLDNVLKTWKARLSAVAENLMELQSDSTYQSLTGEGGLVKVHVTGATATRVGAALRTMNELFLRFGLLQSTVDRAEEIRRGLPAMFGAEAKWREIQQLLFTRSIELQASDVPLAERHLLSGARTAQSVSPEELLDSMTRTFAEVRDAVSDVGKAWSEFAVGDDRVEREIARLRSQAVMPSSLLAPMLDEVIRRLATTREQMQSDPMGALATLRGQVEPSLATANQRVLASERMQGELRAARGRWKMLERLHGEAVAVAEEASARLVAAPTAAGIVPEEKLRALAEWLTRLERKCDDGAVEAVAVGLRNWSAATEACTVQDRTVLTRWESQLASRNELLGRMEALKAKARAYGWSEIGDIPALCSGAEDLLHARPMDLRRASDAVAHYEQRLRAARPASEPVGNAGRR